MMAEVDRNAGTVRHYMSLIKLSHSVFALPFALIALLVATAGRPSWRLLGLVLVAMVTARSAAMAYNRYADRDIDARNPRTRNREIPSGVVHPRAALGFALVAALGFVVTCGLLGSACLWMSVPVLVVLLGYSHAKRFTSLSHLWLGVALGLSPPAAWLAARGEFDQGIVAALALGLGVATWVAGFDVLYACQDEDFDRREGLHSLPVRLGRRGALRVARLLHAVAVVLFFGFGGLTDLGLGYHLGVAIAAVVLGVEHRLVTPADLGRIDLAFFTLNGVVGLALLACTVIDIYLI